MKLAVVLACFVVSCLADKPQPCTSPPLLTGGISVTSQNEKISIHGKYLYDGQKQRVRLFDIGSFKNQSFTADVLLHLREAVVYEINDAKKTCKKSPLTADFQPLKIPKYASLLAQTVSGISSVPGQELRVNNWHGTYKLGGYLITVTESGCFPVSSSFQTTEFGWVSTNYYNNVIGITDPDRLEPPAFCAEAVMDAEAQPRNFFSSLANLPNIMLDCDSFAANPPLLTGGLMVNSQNEKISMHGKYLYDAVGQRVRLFDVGSFKKPSFTADVLLHFREAVMYEINDARKTCKKSPLKADFQPLKIPNDVALLSQNVMGSSSAPGQGVLVNNWHGTYKSGGFLMTVTEPGCFPVSSIYQTTEFGWVTISYFNNVIGITDMDQLEPPAFCAGAVMDAEAEPRNFLSSLVL